MKHGKAHDHHHRNGQAAEEQGELPVPVAHEAAAAEQGAMPPAKGTTPKPDDRYLRLQADFENFRKRAARERADIIRRANADLLMDLLPCIDNLDRALEQARALDRDDPFIAGVQMVMDQLQNALNKNGVTTFDPVGQPFDVSRHEAVSQIPTDDHPANSVIAQIRKGYLLGDILLRPAQVVVAAAITEQPAAEPAQADSEEPVE